MKKEANKKSYSKELLHNYPWLKPKFKQTITSWILGLVVSFFAHTAYIAGITLLVPALFISHFPPTVAKLPTTSGDLSAGAFALIVISLLLLYAQKRTLHETLICLGRMTLVPGTIALLFALLGRKAIFAIIHPYATEFGVVGPIIEQHIDNALPKVWFMTIAYIVIGYLLYKTGKGIEKRQKHLPYHLQR